MRPTSKQLAMRDPALAALMGAHVGADFGGDYDFSGDPEPDFGWEFGADAPPPAGNVQAWAQKAAREQAITDARVRLMQPNADSRVKVQRYIFGLSTALVLGAGGAGPIAAQNNPSVKIRPQRVSCNAPAPGFATLTALQVGNVNVFAGGVLDAFFFNANGVGQSLDLPMIEPANQVQLAGAYSGYVPTGYAGGAAFTFSVGLTGPATITA